MRSPPLRARSVAVVTLSGAAAIASRLARALWEEAAARTAGHAHPPPFAREHVTPVQEHELAAAPAGRAVDVGFAGAGADHVDAMPERATHPGPAAVVHG